MALRLVEAAEGVAEKLDELALRAAAEAFGDVGHDRFGGVVDLDDQAVIGGEWGGQRLFKNGFGPGARLLPDEQVGEQASARHGRLLCAEVRFVPEIVYRHTVLVTEYSVLGTRG